jgi:nitric oxide reductase large subunit
VVLLAVAIICFAVFFWATALTFDRAPPQPDRFIGTDGATLMTVDDIVGPRPVDTPEFFPIGWPQLNAVFEQGFAYARSIAFYDGTLIWQWLRLPGDVLFAIAALLMAWDFIVKLGPLLPAAVTNFLRLPQVQPRALPAE